MPKQTSPFSSWRRHQAGLTLIELLIAVLLGLLVVAAGMGLLLSNRKTYGTTQAVSRIQENQRVAFEMLSADIRSAGDYPCLALSRPGRVVVHANKRTGTTPGFEEELFNKQRDGLKGTDNGIIIYSHDNERGSYLDASEAMGYRYAVVKHDNPADPVEVVNANLFKTRERSRENMVLCNADRAVVFNASKVENNKIYHETSAGNCGEAFVYDPSNNADNLWNALDTGSKCNGAVASKNGRNRYCFGPNAKVGENGCDRVGNSPAFVVSMAKLDTRIHWVVTDKKLRRNMDEIVDGVASMELKYRLHGETEYKEAASIDSKKWGRVDSVHVKIVFEAPGPEEGNNMDTKGVDGKTALTRTMEGYVAIRNKLRNQPDN